MHIKKGDQVKIIVGKDRGKSGSVLRALPGENRIIVEGMNLVSKRTRPKRQGQKGETVQVPRPMHVSNVMIVCKNCGTAVRVGSRILEGRKMRSCRKCNATL